MSLTQRVLALALRNARVLARTGPNYPAPIDLVRISSDLGIRSIEPACLDVDGYLGIDDSGELFIRYKESNLPSRNRFTIAHELGHVLLARAAGEQITREINRSDSPDEDEERAADRIASELLMREDVVRKEMMAAAPTWARINRLRACFRVSVPAMVFRFLEIRGMMTALLRIRIKKSTGALIRCRWDSSKHAPLSLLMPVANEARRILHDLSSNGRTYLRVRTPDGIESITFGYFARQTLFASSDHSEYWAIGWVPDRNST